MQICSYARLVQQEENRFVTMKRHLLDERELRKKERQKENYIKRMQSFEGSTIIWPDVGLDLLNLFTIF